MTNCERLFHLLNDTPWLDVKQISSRLAIQPASGYNVIRALRSALPAGTLIARLSAVNPGRKVYMIQPGTKFPSKQTPSVEAMSRPVDVEARIVDVLERSKKASLSLGEIGELTKWSAAINRPAVTTLVQQGRIGLLKDASSRGPLRYCSLSKMPKKAVRYERISKMEGTYSHWANTAPRDGSLDPHRPHIGSI